MDGLVASQRNLNLGDKVQRKRSEVQMYMILYYDTHIREAVLKRWAEDGAPGSQESRVEAKIPESEIESHESFDMKDPKIPISYKHKIALQLYEAESDETKAEVRSQREAWHGNGRTVRGTDEAARLSLVREYQKYVHDLLA